MDLSQDKKIFS